MELVGCEGVDPALPQEVVRGMLMEAFAGAGDGGEVQARHVRQDIVYEFGRERQQKRVLLRFLLR